MTREEAIKYGIEWLEDEHLDAKDRAFIKIALEALEQEPCEDAISRELKIGDEIYIRANINEIRKDYIICENAGGYFGTVREEIFVNPQEPKTGHWIALESRFELGDRVKCSECGQVFVVGDDVSRHYCPNCGTKMVEPQESEG